MIPFLIAAFVLAITPGPGIAYVVARTVSGGRKEGLASCIGTGIGGLIHVMASALGVSLIIAQSAFAFSVVKYVGAAYLFYLGFRMLFSKNAALMVGEISPQGARRAFLEGIAVEALNVKTALFFLAFLPQFTNPIEPLMPQLVLLGSICVVLNTLVDILAVLGANRLLTASAKRAQRERMMVKTSGITMLGLGTYLALAERN
jgi:threonine/homoserine/homoserine lactone efflux protein